jgi:excisionase family DNA binding protein
MTHDQAIDVYSKKETAQRLRISDQTLHQLTKTGTLRTVKAGRRVLILRAALEAFLSTDQK